MTIFTLCHHKTQLFRGLSWERGGELYVATSSLETSEFPAQTARKNMSKWKEVWLEMDKANESVRQHQYTHKQTHTHTQADRLLWSSRRFEVLFSEDVWAQCTCRHWSTNKPPSQTRRFMYSVFLCSGVCEHVCMRTGTEPIKLSHLKAFLCSSSELLDRQPASCDLQMAGTKRFSRKMKKLQDAAFFPHVYVFDEKPIVKSVFWLMVSWRGMNFCREKERKRKGRGREGAE